MYTIEKNSVDKTKKTVLKRGKRKKLKRESNKDVVKELKKKNRVMRRKRAKELKRNTLKIMQLRLITEPSFFDFIDKSEFFDKQSIRKIDNDALISIPQVFSLIENPDETLQIYKQIYNVA